MRKLALFVCAVALVLASGCVSAEVKRQIQNGVVIGESRVTKWSELDGVQREQAHWKMVRILHDLNYAINDVPVPEPYLGEFVPTVDKEGKPLVTEEPSDPNEGDGLLDGEAPAGGDR